MQALTETKRCKACGQEKKVTEFWRSGRTGRRSICAKCSGPILAEQRRRNPRPHRQASKNWQAENLTAYRTYQATYRIARRKEVNEQRRQLRRENPQHQARLNAYSAVYYAIRVGKLHRPDRCQKCRSAEGKMEAHHHRGYDQEYRLDVIWLCQRCHDAVHTE